MLKFVFTFVLVAIVLAAPMVAFGQTQAPEPPTPGATTIGELVCVIDNIAAWIFWVLTIVAVIFILLAALQFITAGGDPGQVTEARSKLIYAAVGIIVAVLAFVLPDIVASLVGTGSISDICP